MRTLGPGDEPALITFLERHDPALFLRSNLDRAGIVDRGQRFQGTYAAAFEGATVVSALAHYWNDNVVLRAPVAMPALLEAALAASARRVRGLLGIHAEVVRARALLGFCDAATHYDSREALYTLQLDALKVPDLLRTGRVVCRRPQAGEEDSIVEWRVGYETELIGGRDTPAFRAQARATLADRDLWVLADGDRIVSMSSFNGDVGDLVQVGGVYTPPDLRGRGYARAVVAGSLVHARRRGVTKAVLFTAETNLAAQRAYEALGFVRTGDYGIALFREGHRVHGVEEAGSSAR